MALRPVAMGEGSGNFASINRFNGIKANEYEPDSRLAK